MTWKDKFQQGKSWAVLVLTRKQWKRSRIWKRAGVSERVSATSFYKCFTTRIQELCVNSLPQTAVYTEHRSIASLRAYIETTEVTPTPRLDIKRRRS